ncbi:hypothetical protein AU198_20910 [Mycobacterium sp. GA-1199]|uniref:hypothetical protein n=1 Tax=Mycobacterium sp. GA-1199 TaxID=1772287 RepID=UPI00074A00A8|nr:hypothetical protein AU198_20910 [Mycobacterium sp. GA-1199]
MRKVLLCAAAALFAGGLVTANPPSAEATLCGSVGGSGTYTGGPGAERQRVRQRRASGQRERLHLTTHRSA